MDIITPKGIASYPWLTKPDTKFGEKFKTDLILNPANESVQAFIAKCDSFCDKERKKALVLATKDLEACPEGSANPKTIKKRAGIEKLIEKLGEDEYRKPYFDEYDKDTDEPTGNVVVRVKCNAEGKNKKTGEVYSLAPKMFDAHANILSERPDVFGGSKLALKIILIYLILCWSYTKSMVFQKQRILII